MGNNIRFINYINKLKSIFPMLLSVVSRCDPHSAAGHTTYDKLSVSLDLFWSFVGVPTFVG